MRLSYCYPSPERIPEGVRRLAAVMDAELDLQRHVRHERDTSSPGREQRPRPDLS